MALVFTRRRFTASAAGLLATRFLRAQTPASARIDVAAAVRPRVLAEAKRAIVAPLLPVSSPASSNFAKALRDTSATVACLAAAYLLTKDEALARRAGEHFEAWFATPATRMSTQPDLPGTTATLASPRIVDLVPLAEMARALSFLVDSAAFSPDALSAVNTWYRSFSDWMNESRPLLLARDAKDHRASAWLLVQAAITRSQRDEKGLEACRKLLKHPTLRNQITAAGTFPQELATPDPFRNTLFNFDLLFGACQLLQTPFEDLWNFELQDGPGLRAVVAYLYPAMQDRGKWPWVADTAHFRELPGPRPGLLFAGRAYNRAEYVELWRTLDAKPVSEDIAASFPIRQPLLWTARAAHGL